MKSSTENILLNNVFLISSIFAWTERYSRHCKLDLNDPNVIENINNSASAEIYDLINNSVNEVFKYKSDIFGLGNILYKKDPKLWKKLEKDWNNNLDKLDIKVESKINIKSKGSLKNTLKDELDNAKD